MRALVLALIAPLLVAPAAASALDRMEAPPKGWHGPVFIPSFAFPAVPPPDAHPWEGISFRQEPKQYLAAVLTYVLEGQDKTDWRLAKNRVRRWYHVPWMGPGATGREFIHGLTRERDFSVGELGAGQTQCRQNWAVAFYNPAGGVILGRIWRKVAHASAPDLSALPFPSGTVVAKLVFTEASADDWPALDGAPQIDANIHAGVGDTACPPATTANGRPAPRTPRHLRLIQVDIAVREPTATYKTGWVFASFYYDGRMPGADPWSKLEPIGLMWGNNPYLSDAEAASGAKPGESMVFTDIGLGHALGRGGRMNGLVDERGSACSSCHMAAQWPTAAHMIPPATWTDAKCWFRNLDARYPFGLEPNASTKCGDLSKTSAMVPLDFSLQLAIGLRNWSIAHTADGGALRRTALGRLRRNGKNLTVNEVPSVELRR